MIPLDFYVTVEPDPWGDDDMVPLKRPRLNTDLLQSLRVRVVEGRTDLEVALALSALAHDELLAFGTGGGESMNDREIEMVLTALRAVTSRIGARFDPPYRNFQTFKSYWLRNDGYNSWQARRSMLEDLFEPLHRELIALETNSLDGLASAVSARTEVGWPLVDEEIIELRRRFQTATTAQDYRALGTNCIGVLEALSATVYDPAKHLRDSEEEPPIDKTKQRIGRYIEDSNTTSSDTIRALTVKAIELAQAVKHAGSTRVEAGIAADSVILLANILRRLHESPRT